MRKTCIRIIHIRLKKMTKKRNGSLFIESKYKTIYTQLISIKNFKKQKTSMFCSYPQNIVVRVCKVYGKLTINSVKKL